MKNLIKWIKGLSCAAVFLAPGLWAASSLKGEERALSGLYNSVNYLSALRDGRLEEMFLEIEGKRVVVIGGGSVAMDCAESAAKLEAEDVYLVYRRSYKQMPAEEDERLKCLEAGVHYFVLNQPIGYITNDVGGICGIRLVRTRLGERDESGRRRPEEIEGLTDFMAERGIAKVGDLVGKALPNLTTTDLFDLERQGIASYNLDKCVGCGQCRIVCHDAGGHTINWDYESRPRDWWKRNVSVVWYIVSFAPWTASLVSRRCPKAGNVLKQRYGRQ